MTEEQKSRAKELAEANWRYNYGFLEAANVEQVVVDAVAYAYITAFEHGYKHAVEDRK